MSFISHGDSTVGPLHKRHLLSSHLIGTLRDMSWGWSSCLWQRAEDAEDHSASPHQQSAACEAFVRGEVALNFSLAVSSLNVFFFLLCQMAAILFPSRWVLGGWSQRTPSWDHQHLWAVIRFRSSGLKSSGSGWLTHWRGDTAGLHDAALQKCCVVHKFN